MSQQHFTVPPSILAKIKDVKTPQKQTREEYQKQKGFEELQKAGLTLPQVDQQGKYINPHIPKYIANVPWYLIYNHTKPTLKHQRIHTDISKQYHSVIQRYDHDHDDKVETHYRPSSSKNYSEKTHKRKNCVEHPRYTGVRFTDTDFKSDEYVQPDINLSWDEKHDRWNGVDINWHQQKFQDEHTRLAKARKILKDKKLYEKPMIEEQKNSKIIIESSDPIVTVANKLIKFNEKDKSIKIPKFDLVDIHGQHIHSKQCNSVCNLRIRENTAKYLLNLNGNSAYYDPKSRSMRANPFIERNKDLSKVSYSGENFIRHSGDAKDFAKNQIFAWETSEKGNNIHAQSDPTKLELLNKEFHEKKINLLKLFNNN